MPRITKSTNSPEKKIELKPQSKSPPLKTSKKKTSSSTSLKIKKVTPTQDKSTSKIKKDTPTVNRSTSKARKDSKTVNKNVSNVKKEEEISKTQKKFIASLNMIYKKAVDGIGGDGSSPAAKLARKYLEKSFGDEYKASRALVKKQQLKTFSTGFVSSFGGFVMLPLTLPADLTASLFIELRMIAAVAILGGYDVHDPKVRTMCMVCLIGGNIKKLLKNAGVKLSKESMKKAFAKIPNKVFINVNKKVGAKLFTKLGGKGTAGIGRAIPVLGGFIGGGINIIFTGYVGKAAVQTFIIENMSDEEKEKRFPKKEKVSKISVT